VKRFQKDRNGTAAFSVVVNTATQVDATVNSLNLGTRATDSWQRVRLAVQQLAAAYNVPAPFSGATGSTAVQTQPLLAAPLAQAQTRVSDRDMIVLMRNLNDDAKRFKPRFDDAVQKSAIRKTAQQKQAKKQVEALVRQTQDLLKRFNKDRSGTAAFSGVVNTATQVDATVNSLNLGTRATDSWQRVRLAVQQLAAAYNVPAPFASPSISTAVANHVPAPFSSTPTSTAAPQLQRTAAESQSVYRDTSARSMENVPDFLNGQHYLLVNDDLSMLQVVPGAGTKLTTQLITMDTSNSVISPQRQTTDISSFTPPNRLDKNEAPFLAAEGVGRMFNTSGDQIVILSPTQKGSGITWGLSIVDRLRGVQFSIYPGFHYTPGSVMPATRIVMGDFTGDGFSDALLFARLFLEGSKEDWAMSIAAAKDPNIEEEPKIGLAYGQVTSPNDSPLPNAIVAGDFNNDGRDEIAMLKGDGQTIEFFTIDPSTLRIRPAGTPLKLPYPMVPSVVTLVAGRFRGCVGCRANADLAVVGEVQGRTDKISVIPIQVTPNADGSFTPKVVPAPASNPYYQFMPSRGTQFVKAQAAPLASWPQVAPEQLIIGVGDFMNFSSGRIDIGTFRQTDSNNKELGQFDWESTSETGKLDIRGMQAGNFDNKCAVVVKDTCDDVGAPNPALQIEAYGTYFSGYLRHGQQIYSVRVPDPFPPPGFPPANWLTARGNLYTWGPVEWKGIQDHFALNVLPADLQGRSAKLGAPIIARVPMQIQPDLVLGMPPMHADWIAPHVNPIDLNQSKCTSRDTPCLMNLPVLPTQPNRENAIAFNTSMDWSKQDRTETTQATTVDMNWAVGIEGSAGFGFGGAPDVLLKKRPGLFQFDASLKYTGSKAYKDVAGTSTSHTEGLNITTGYSDFVLFSQQRMNYYYYPVIGRKTCVIAADPCPANEEGPAFAVFSAPDAVAFARVEGNTQWWYQPIQEPGNVLSYPPDKQQLQGNFSEVIKTFTKDLPICNGIGTNSTTISNTWTTGVNTDYSFGETHSISESVSIAVSNKVAPAKVSPFYRAKFSQSYSKSWGTLLNGATSLQSSKGIKVNLPSFNDGVISQCCGYAWADYIFGLDNPYLNQIQSGKDIVKSPDNNPIEYAENVVKGPLFVGFLADPLAGDPTKKGPLSACTAHYNWWKQVYNKPDVALNHPNRLNWNRARSEVNFNDPDRSGKLSPLNQQFYQMKGFFITETDGPTPAPNLPSATAGDKLTLTARVYNYSLVDTTGTVHVRIYGQRYCPSGSSNDPSCIDGIQNKTCSAGTLCGGSFQIGQTSIPLIPGFKSRSDGMGGYSPNWTTVSVPFDNTADYSGEYLVFWVVAWMQDGSGNLVAEMPDHGLTSVPDKNIADILQVPIEAHSNNVGLYGAFHQFFIAPKTSTEATGAIARLRDASMVTSRQDTLDQAAPVRIAVQAGAGAPAKIVNVAFYDGDPAQGGRLLDYQVITQINPGMLYAYNDRFNANSCGVHTLYTEAWLPGQSPVRSSTNVAVTANLADLTQSLMTATQSASIRDSEIKKDLLTQLDVALKSFQRKQTGNGEKLIDVYMRALSNDTNKGISQEDAAPLIGRARQVLSCGQSDYARTTDLRSATATQGDSPNIPLP
jgi:hypothetical protein